MSESPWSQHDADGSSHRVEVPLSGDAEPVHVREPDGVTDRRRAAAFAVAGVIAVGAVIAVVGTLGDSQASTPTTTSPEQSDVDERAGAALPSATSTSPPRATSGVPDTEPPLAMPELAGVVVPTFPPIDGGTGQVGAVGADLGRAVARLDDRVALRSTTHVTLGYDGWVREITILRDPVNDRYQLTITGAERAANRLIIDMATETTYYPVDDTMWMPSSNREDAESVGVADIGVLVDRLLLGPLRTDTFDAAEIEPAERVTIGTEESNAFRVSLPGAEVPEWQLYFFAPDEEFDPADRPPTLVYDVYVSDDGELSTIIGAADIGGIAQLVEHRIEIFDEPIEIALPDQVGRRDTRS